MLSVQLQINDLARFRNDPDVRNGQVCQDVQHGLADHHVQIDPAGPIDQVARVLSRLAHLGLLISIDLAYDTGQEFRTAIVLEKIQAAQDRVKLISTPNTLVPVAIQGIEANRERY